MSEREVICGIELGGFYERGGEVWQVVTIADRPTMRLRNLHTGEQVGGVIGAPIFDGFEKLVRETRATIGPARFLT